MIGRMGEPCSHLCTLVEGTGGYLIIGIERRALKVYVACRGGGGLGCGSRNRSEPSG